MTNEKPVVVYLLKSGIADHHTLAIVLSFLTDCAPFPCRFVNPFSLVCECCKEGPSDAVVTTPHVPIVAAKYGERHRTLRDETPLLPSVCIVSPSLIEEEEDILRSMGNLYRQGL